MAKVRYETEDALFEFDLMKVTERLEYLAFEKRADEAFDLLNFLSSDLLESMKIPEDKHYFGYVVMDLLTQEEGSVKCKRCEKTYHPDDLEPAVPGYGQSESLEDLKGKKGGNLLVGKKRKLTETFGGVTLQCPEGHDLISVTRLTS